MSNHIRELRESYGLTQKALGDELGVTRGTVSLWETGSSPISQQRLTQLAAIFHVDVNEIVDQPTSGGMPASSDSAPSAEPAAAVNSNLAPLRGASSKIRASRNVLSLSELDEAIQLAQGILRDLEIPFLMHNLEQIASGKEAPLSWDEAMARLNHMKNTYTAQPVSEEP